MDGGTGNDMIVVTDDNRVDQISCGDGHDEVYFHAPKDLLDVVAGDCEDVHQL